MAIDPEEEHIPPEPSGVVIGSVILFVLSLILVLSFLCADFLPSTYDRIETALSRAINE